MNTTLSLEQTKAQFAHWRDNKETLGTITPDKLRKQAVELTQHYSTTKVVTTLGLSGSVIKRWQSDLKLTQTTDAPIDAFVALPNSQAVYSTIAQASIVLNDGSSIVLNGGASTQLLSVIAQACNTANQL